MVLAAPLFNVQHLKGYEHVRWKCPAECGEKGDAIVTWIVPRVPQEVTVLSPSSLVVFVLSNSPALSRVFVCSLSVCVAAPP